jgi:hypothetical protein
MFWMTNNAKNFLIFVLVATGVFHGCATLGTEVTTNNNRIQMPSYSFVVPANQGWHLQQDDGREYAILTKQVQPIMWQIRIYKNPVMSQILQSASAEEVADDFRKLEVQVMIEEGVKKGQYQLRDVKMGEEIVDNKQFYTMHHVIVSQSIVQKASMYLYFPQPRNNRYFFAAHYFETTPPNVIAKSYKQDLLAVLASLHLK